jgi:hypothetical protein
MPCERANSSGRILDAKVFPEVSNPVLFQSSETLKHAVCNLLVQLCIEGAQLAFSWIPGSV